MVVRSGQWRPAARSTMTGMLLVALLMSGFAFGLAHASVPVPSVQSYTQNFDSLPATGAPAWQNDVTLRGWYAAAGNAPFTTITAYDNANPSPAGGLYSFGSTGSTDRALGVVGGFNAGNGSQRIGVVLKNTSGSRIKRLTISYKGEQWVDGNMLNTPEKLQFKYKKSATGATLGATDIQTSLGFTSNPALDFTSPQNSGVGALNGNDPANSRVVSATLDLRPDLGPNQEMLLVWEKDNVAPGTDDGIAIDDLSITAGFGVALPVASCPPTITTFRTADGGSALTEPVSAFDPNGTVTQAQITSAAVPGVSLAGFVPATNPGDIATANLQIDGTQAPGDYPITIQFTSQEQNETRSCTTLLKVRSVTDLAVAKDGPATYRAGQQVNYDITVNPGRSAATNVVVTDTLPLGLSYVSDNSGVTPTITGQQVVWNLGTLPVQRVIALTAQAASTATGTLTNKVSVGSTAQDDDQTDNAATTSATLFVGPPDFSESRKTVSSTTVQVGQVFTYTLTLNNSGDIDSTFAVTDTLPANLTLVSAPGMTQAGQLLTATAPISGGDQLQYPISVRANAAGTVNNVAQLSGDGTTRSLAAPPVTVLPNTVPPTKVYLPMIRK